MDRTDRQRKGKKFRCHYKKLYIYLKKKLFLEDDPLPMTMKFSELWNTKLYCDRCTQININIHTYTHSPTNTHIYHTISLNEQLCMYLFIYIYIFSWKRPYTLFENWHPGNYRSEKNLDRSQVRENSFRALFFERKKIKKTFKEHNELCHFPPSSGRIVFSIYYA